MIWYAGNHRDVTGDSHDLRSPGIYSHLYVAPREAEDRAFSCDDPLYSAFGKCVSEVIFDAAIK